ncbi:transposase [Pseudogemmobacter sp. CC-YST710]|uniref:Transposase n=1 Tax=Pseudogemmobacter faecipullorum TaxID=2755041 RepID=A0ABS8CM99_9RHOB|nr:transposase [Pseudogemmobacter faecipullorum]
MRDAFGSAAPRLTVRPPIGKQRQYRHQELQIIHAEELNPPEGRSPIFGRLITNLPVATHADTDAVHKLEWYALRWKIETFFRTLKTGCRIEELRLATADRLANCIALCCIAERHRHQTLRQFLQTKSAIYSNVQRRTECARHRTTWRSMHGSAAISTERPTRHLGPQSSGGAYRVSLISSKEHAWQSRRRKLMGNCKPVRAVCPVFANRLKALPYVIFYTFSLDRDFHRR